MQWKKKSNIITDIITWIKFIIYNVMHRHRHTHKYVYGQQACIIHEYIYIYIYIWCNIGN